MTLPITERTFDRLLSASPHFTATRRQTERGATVETYRTASGLPLAQLRVTPWGREEYYRLV